MNLKLQKKEELKVFSCFASQAILPGRGRAEGFLVEKQKASSHKGSWLKISKPFSLPAQGKFCT